MKKILYGVICAMLICTMAYAGPPRGRGHHGGHHGGPPNSGLALAAGIVNLVGAGVNIIRPPVVVTSPTVVTTPVVQPVCSPAPVVVTPPPPAPMVYGQPVYYGPQTYAPVPTTIYYNGVPTRVVGPYGTTVYRY